MVTHSAPEGASLYNFVTQKGTLPDKPVAVEVENILLLLFLRVSPLHHDEAYAHSTLPT